MIDGLLVVEQSVELVPALGTRLAMIVTTADIQQIHTEKGSKHPGTANNFLIVVRKMLLLLTGLRMRELLKAKWTDIDWDAGTLFIGLTKNGEPLLAPLSDEALARLRRIPRLANNSYIICGKSRGEHFRELGPVLRRILKRAEIENLRVHDLRRTVGSWLAQGGTTLHLIGDVLSHLDPKTTAGYAYFQTQQRRDVLTQHANKVLAYVPQQSSVVVEPKTLSAEQLLRTDANVLADRSIPPAAIPYRHFFEREELYKLVWTAPVSEVARKLAFRTSALQSCAAERLYPSPLAVTGPGSNLANISVPSRCLLHRQVCLNFSGFAHEQYRIRREWRLQDSSTRAPQMKRGSAAKRECSPRRQRELDLARFRSRPRIKKGRCFWGNLKSTARIPPKCHSRTPQSAALLRRASRSFPQGRPRATL